MIRSHVFVVNENTLPIHLSYKFVGVSSGERDNDISLLADMMRTKKEDFIFFYIEGSETKKGRFFGIFKLKENEVYHFKGDEARKPQLPKKLIYRKFIEPYKVYSEGVLEWIALDKLPTYAKEIIWTLIYRKMKGKRGNTMLFPWETEKLLNLIQETNNGNNLNSLNFSFNAKDYKIETAQTSFLHHHQGEIIKLERDVIKRSETHFQAYLLQEINVPQNGFYIEIFGKNILWLGNEVFAGSGMQKIDIFTIEKVDELEYIYRIIELKHPKSKTNIDFSPSQLEYYIKWARDDIGGHIQGAKKFNIKPILLVLTEKFNSVSKNIIDSIKNLEEISYKPEIWEMNFNGKTNKIL